MTATEYSSGDWLAVSRWSFGDDDQLTTAAVNDVSCVFRDVNQLLASFASRELRVASSL